MKVFVVTILLASLFAVSFADVIDTIYQAAIQYCNSQNKRVDILGVFSCVVKRHPDIGFWQRGIPLVESLWRLKDQCINFPVRLEDIGSQVCKYIRLENTVKQILRCFAGGIGPQYTEYLEEVVNTLTACVHGSY